MSDLVKRITATEPRGGSPTCSTRWNARRRVRVEYVERLLERLPVEVYDLTVARSHAELLGFTRAHGTPRGAHHLIIAATAAAQRRIVVTRDRLGFGGLPGVEVRIV